MDDANNDPDNYIPGAEAADDKVKAMVGAAPKRKIY